MASDEKRMAGDYEVIHAIEIGDKEIVVGEWKDAPAGERYMCAYCRMVIVFDQYTEAIGSDDYAEIMQEFGERVAKQAEKTRIELNKAKIQGIDNRPLSATDCVPDSQGTDLRNKIVVVRAECLRREYRSVTNQIKLCIGGSGASPFSRGTSCLCVDLYSGGSEYFGRSDVMGTLDEAKLPNWAKRGLAEYRLKQKEKRERGGEARDER